MNIQQEKIRRVLRGLPPDQFIRGELADSERQPGDYSLFLVRVTVPLFFQVGDVIKSYIGNKYTVESIDRSEIKLRFKGWGG